MAKKAHVPKKFQGWIEARKRHKLSHAQIQMGRELGMNPKSLGKLDNHKQQPWKVPLGQFIELCYLERFGKLPEEVLSIEQRIEREKQKKTKRREEKRLREEDSGNSGPFELL